MKSSRYLIVPSAIGIIIFLVIPYVYIFKQSFFRIDGKWMGVSYYKSVLQNEAYVLAMKNTFLFIVICVPLLLCLSLLLAITINKNTKIGMLFKTGALFPMVLPVASVAFFWKIMFHKNGLLNSILSIFSVSEIDWINTKYSFILLVVTYIWKNLGYCIILWIAALATVPKNQYEAAMIEGADRIQVFKHVVFPNIFPSALTICLLSIINIFKIYREAYLIGGNYPNKHIYMIQHIFNNWFKTLDFNKLAAGSIIMTLFLFILIFALQKMRGWQYE